MSQLVSIRYKSVNEDISRHMDQITALVEQISSMGTNLAEDLTIGILVSSIEVSVLQTVAATMKKLAEKEIYWEYFTSRLIEELKSVNYGNGK